MRTKTHISIHYTGGTVKVKKGDTVKKGDILVALLPQTIQEFALTKLLNVAPKNLAKYLLVKEGEMVAKDSMIAQKGGLLRREVIRAPLAGTFVIVDSGKGIVGIQQSGVGQTVVAWCNGIVEKIESDTIIVSVVGLVIPLQKGSGGPVSGKLIVFPGEATLLAMPTDLDNTIIVMKHAQSDVIAKVDALGAKGIVTEIFEPPEFVLPYGLVPDISGMVKYHHKTVVLHGEGKELLILEE